MKESIILFFSSTLAITIYFSFITIVSWFDWGISPQINNYRILGYILYISAILIQQQYILGKIKKNITFLLILPIGLYYLRILIINFAQYIADIYVRNWLETLITMHYSDHFMFATGIGYLLIILPDNLKQKKVYYTVYERLLYGLILVGGLIMLIFFIFQLIKTHLNLFSIYIYMIVYISLSQIGLLYGYLQYINQINAD